MCNLAAVHTTLTVSHLAGEVTEDSAGSGGAICCCGLLAEYARGIKLEKRGVQNR